MMAVDVDWDLVARLIAGMLAGMVIGINRTRRRKGIGVRTLGLVGLGSAIAVAMFHDATDANAASRAVQGLVTGIGFLGAGVILHRASDDMPHGLTTAAAIWLTSMLGAAAGKGDWLPVIVGTALAMSLLAVGEGIERLFGGQDGNSGAGPPG
jgi:putative Mg2+ transporter-C (MgtC) family protein